jgi:CBS domain-containing protein
VLLFVDDKVQCVAVYVLLVCKEEMVPRKHRACMHFIKCCTNFRISSDFEARLHALPVVDAKHGNLVGIVTAKDVMRDVIRMASKALPSEEKFSQKMMSDIPDLAA